MKKYREMVELFEKANRQFLIDDLDLLENIVSERTLCGALMIQIHDLIKEDSKYKNYFVDVEYNRNKGEIKTICRTSRNSDFNIMRINCDLIVHSRGHYPEQDNLIAIEMKKASAPNREKEKDRERLMALTKSSYNDIWSADGKALPEHVCGYSLGIYYEINYIRREILIEYYRSGKCVEEYKVNF